MCVCSRRRIIILFAVVVAARFVIRDAFPLLYCRRLVSLVVFLVSLLETISFRLSNKFVLWRDEVSDLLVSWHSDGVRVATATTTTTSARSLCFSVILSTVNTHPRPYTSLLTRIRLSFFLPIHQPVLFGMSVYNVVIMCVIGGGRAGRFIRHHIDLDRFLHNGHPLSRLR